MDLIRAVRAGRVHEIPAEIILQPGSTCLTDGLDRWEELLYPPEPAACVAAVGVGSGAGPISSGAPSVWRTSSRPT